MIVLTDERLKRYEEISALLLQVKPRFRNKPQYLSIIHLFLVKKATLAVMMQHATLVKKATDTPLPEIKAAIGELAFTLAVLLQQRNGKQKIAAGGLHTLPAKKELFSRNNRGLIAFCKKVVAAAGNEPHRLALNGTGVQAVTTLKSAINIYSAIEPPPRAALLLVQHYTNALEKLFKETEKMLHNEVDTLMLTLVTAKPALFEQYVSIREFGSLEFRSL
jgi:hypothetical protein